MPSKRPTIRRPPYDEVKKGDYWGTSGGIGYERMMILTEPFEWHGELWVAVLKDSDIRPSCDTVDWILAGGECLSREGED